MRDADESALLDILIPPSADGRMPGGNAVEFAAYAARRGLATFIREGVATLDLAVREKTGRGFAAMQPAEAADVLRSIERAHAAFLAPLMKHLVQCYYQNGAVLHGIGVEARPPFPDGFMVEDGDLTLLEPVLDLGPRYRL